MVFTLVLGIFIACVISTLASFAEIPLDILSASQVTVPSVSSSRDNTISSTFELKAVLLKCTLRRGWTTKFPWGFYWGRNAQIQKIRVF